MIYELDGVRPRIHEGAWIAPTASVIGNVTVGPGASIWFGAVLRGDGEPIEIGEESNVQDNAVIHTDPGCPTTIGARCTIGHKAIVHGCTILEESLIGMGATVLNRAVIGRHVLVGAGALVTEGREIADCQLAVGVPAKAVRALGEEAIEGLRRSAAHYAANGRRFAAGLKALG